MAMQNPCTFMSASVKISLSHLSINETDRHKSISRQYIGRANDWVEWTLEKPRALGRNARTSRIVCCLAAARQQ